MSIAAGSFDGVWTPVAAELGGEPAPAMVLEQLELELTGGSYVVRFGGVAADLGRFEVDPAGLTLRGTTGPNAGRTIPCLVRLESNRLVVCYGMDGVRPTRFATGPGDPAYLATYVRRARSA